MRQRPGPGRGAVAGAIARAASMLVASAGLLLAFDAAPAPSALCPNLAASVARGGSVAINVSACDGPFDAGVSGPVAPFAANGAVSIGRNAFGTQSVTYVHNGSATTADAFALEDNNLGVITVTVTVNPPASALAVLPASLPTPVIGAAYSQILSAGGGTAPYTFSLGTGNAPPGGLTLTAAGALSGTPSARGPFAFAVTVTDNLGASVVKAYSGTVANPSLAISPAATTALQGIPLSLPVQASGGLAPYTVTLESGSLPAGISLSGGALAGTTNAAPGNYPVTLRVADSSTGPGAYFELKTLTVTVAPAPGVTIGVSPASVTENGTANLVFTVTRTAALNVPTTVNFTIGGTATAGADYTVAASPVTIPAGATSATLVADPVADGIAEPDETVVVTLVAGTGYTVGAPASATGTLVDGKTAQAIVFGTAPAIAVGTTGTVSATGGGSGNPVVFTSLTAPTCSVSGSTVSGLAEGTCTIAANQAGNGQYEAAAQATQSFAIASAASIPRLGNISTRMRVLTGADVLIGGFIIGGAQPKTVVVRARGPSLAAAGVPGPLANPLLQLFSGPTQIAANDNWQDAANAAAIATSGFAPSEPLESAILVTLAPGAYTGIVTGVGGASGVGIIEIFEVDLPQVPLANISTRGRVLTGDDVMIGGFIIQGTSPKTVIIRARGPSLAAAGVPGVLGNPLMQVFAGSTQIAVNDNWQDGPDAATIEAAGFAPLDALESAVRLTLAPGAYTVIVTGLGGTTGVAIVEVFAQ